MEEDIAEAKNVADVVVVSMHAGDEYADDVTDTQVDFAHKAIRAGAALVIGSHPHVVQPVENYHGGVILYSLGNFVFDQLQSDATRQSVIAVAHFRGAEVQKVEFTPVVIGDDFAPRVVSSVDGSTVLKRLGEEVHTTGVITWDASAKTYVMTETTLNVEYNTRAEDSTVDDATYQYALSDGQLTVTRSGMPFWTSPEEWYVDSYALADAVGDGTRQLTMSVWKAGDFGPSKPFWVTENDPSVKNHFFVFKFTDDTLEPVWQSSNLEHPNCAYVFRDLDTDGKDELVVTEGTYTDGRICNPTHAAVWEWSEWGFYNEWRSTAAVYTNLRPNGATVVVDVQHD
jgi:poly-gamma-glutamate synthesis protein (capsule biosynthesis protein)